MTKPVLWTIACLSAAFTGCTPADDVRAKEKARQAGHEVERELKQAGRELKHAGHEVKRELDKAGHELKRGMGDAPAEADPKRH